ncbi:MAG: hypothetical protein AAFP04_09305 [Myxococcota bacterium]
MTNDVVANARVIGDYARAEGRFEGQARRLSEGEAEITEAARGVVDRLFEDGLTVEEYQSASDVLARFEADPIGAGVVRGNYPSSDRIDVLQALIDRRVVAEVPELQRGDMIRGLISTATPEHAERVFSDEGRALLEGAIIEFPTVRSRAADMDPGFLAGLSEEALDAMGDEGAAARLVRQLRADVGDETGELFSGDEAEIRDALSDSRQYNAVREALPALAQDPGIDLAYVHERSNSEDHPEFIGLFETAARQWLNFPQQNVSFEHDIGVPMDAIVAQASGERRAAFAEQLVGLSTTASWDRQLFSRIGLSQQGVEQLIASVPENSPEKALLQSVVDHRWVY